MTRVVPGKLGAGGLAKAPNCHYGDVSVPSKVFPGGMDNFEDTLFLQFSKKRDAHFMENLGVAI